MGTIRLKLRLGRDPTPTPTLKGRGLIQSKNRNILKQQISKKTLSYTAIFNHSFLMTKPRRKNDIRADMSRQCAVLEQIAASQEKRVRRPAPWQAIFLEQLRLKNNVRDAAKHCGISFSGVYYARKNDAVFRADWDRIQAAYDRSKHHFLRHTGSAYFPWETRPLPQSNPTTVERQNETVQRQNNTFGADELGALKLDAFTQKHCEKMIAAGKGAELEKWIAQFHNV